MKLDLEAIEASRRRVPPLHATKPEVDGITAEWPGYEYDYAKNERVDDKASTLSPDPTRPGWTNDSGYPGYGLPHPVAEALARMPADADALVARVRELEAAMRALLDDPEAAPIWTDARMAAAKLLGDDV